MSDLTSFRSALETRAAVLGSVRAFFAGRGFLEVETPVRLPSPALELHIDAEPSGPLYLRTSPELHMKRLLSAGYERIYQVGPCFRRGEHGAFHHPEYSMLEWYRSGTDYRGILDDTMALLRKVVTDICGERPVTRAGRAIDVHGTWQVLTVEDAFERLAGWNPVRAYDADRFDVDLSEKVEPGFPAGMPVVLTDYPAEAAALARLKPGREDVAERWELYIGGLELANAYSELTDPTEQEARFRQCTDQRRALGREVYPPDEAFLQALRAGMPQAGGVALGIDRLVMLLAGAESLDEVLPFRKG